MGQIAARIPEWLDRFPRSQVVGYALRNDSSAPRGALDVAGGHEHPPHSGIRVPEDVGIAPVCRLVARGRSESVLRVSLPGVHAVAARCVQHELEREAVGTTAVRILSCVEDVVHAVVVNDDAAGVDIEVRAVRPSGCQRDSRRAEIDEVVGDDAVPWHADLGHLARLVQIEEMERAVFLPGNDVTDPSLGRAEEPSLVHGLPHRRASERHITSCGGDVVNRLRSDRSSA